jgi:Asp-tRNA(Asn)/Glu-tRNA(Gln) amidotransferase A subunit family amidase
MPYRASLCLMTQMVRDREISAAELVEAHLRQIEEANPGINAFVRVFEQESREQARCADAAAVRGEPLGLLHGVPVTVKDSFDIAGCSTACGSRSRAGHRAAGDSTAVARFKAAGAIVLGKTNCSEYLRWYETDNDVAGRTNHPLDATRTAGGSSGGEAAAIAAFCSPGGVGSDGGGSIRIPAHFCGICGLKPTPGRVSAAGHFPTISHPGGLLGVAGPMARTAEDLRLLFSVLGGYDSQDPFSSPVPLTPPVLNGVRANVVESFGRDPALASAWGTLEQIGIPVEPCRPSWLERAHRLWWFFFGRVNGHPRAAGEPPLTADHLLEQLAARDRLRAAVLREMETVPLLLLPVCGVTAFPHGSLDWEEIMEAVRPVTPFNLLGFPAVTIPWTYAEDGMPVGIQIAGRPYEEELVLEVAVRLEEARGPFLSKRSEHAA